MAYSLVTSYAGDALVNGFNWIDTRDYSNGFVKYQSQSNAASQGLFAVDELTGVVRIGVDHTNTYDVSSGRPSIRIESKDAYNRGLFIGDFLHMPPSQCGVWPAFWAYGPNWPAGGEIDIIEGANTAHRNIISAHTTSGCKLGDDVIAMAAGSAQTTNCDVGTDNIGCGYVPAANDTSSYGDTFNAVGGGIYAMLWDDEYIKVWHFDRASAPIDITAKRPDPAGWGRPQAVYGGSACDVGSHFRDMSIVLNINFCGDYGNAVWASDGCTALAPTCAEWVGKNPAAFANAYWDVNYIDAYVMGAPNETTTSSERVSFSSTSTSTSSRTSRTAIPSFTSVPGPANGNYTRFPMAGNSTNGNATSSSSSPSSFSAPLTTAGTAVPYSVPPAAVQGPIPTESLLPRPAPSSKPHANPANLNDFSYLGCFGSSSDFESFTKVADSADMDLDKCTELCKGKKYAGVFDTTCYCASELDADTRVSADTCDTACPGDNSQFCGGRVKRRNDGGVHDGGVGAKANVTLPETSSVVSGGVVPLQTDSGSGDGPAGSFKFKPTGAEKPFPTGTGSPRAGNDTTGPSFASPVGKFNSSAPEILSSSSGSFASGSPVTSGTGTGASAASASPIISAASKFNSTSFQRFPATSGPSVSNSSFTRTTVSNPTPASIPLNVAAKLNSTVPRIPTPVSSGTGIDSVDEPVVTIPVYPIPMTKNVTEPSPSSPRIAAAAPSGPAAPALFPNSTTLVGRRLLAARSLMLKSARPGAIDRREAADFLLTVYAAVAKEEPPKQPPALGINTPNAPAPQAKFPTAAATPAPSGGGGRSTTTTVVTTVTYQTVYPSNPSKVVTETFVTTIVKAHCGCTETPKPVMTVPMSTKVVTCSACGRNGESTVTITVPCSVSIATPTPASGGIAPPVSGSIAPPAPSGAGKPPAATHKMPPAPGKNVPPAPGNNMPPAPGKYVPPEPSKSFTPAAPAPSGNPPPAHHNNQPSASGASMPPAPSGKMPPASPPLVAGASGFKVTSLLFTTMLAMVLLL